MERDAEDAPTVYIKYKELFGINLDVKKERIANILNEVTGGF